MGLTLYFSAEGRSENIRRIGEMVKLFLDAGVIALTAFISPYIKDRNRIRSIIGNENFIEIYCQCDIAVCEQRDVKGLYKRARAGEIKDFTGISAPYEAPTNSDLVLDTGATSLEACTQAIIDFLISRHIINVN